MSQASYWQQVIRWFAVVLWLLVIFVASGDRLSEARSRSVLSWLSGGAASTTITLPAKVGVESGNCSAADSPQAASQSYFWDWMHWGLRKLGHLAEYAILYGLLRFAGVSGAPSLLFCFLFAVSDEIHQAFVPERLGSVTDVGIDGLGCLLGWTVEKLYHIRSLFFETNI